MKILYIMGVEWDWIYQRPHVLAEMLQRKHEVAVVCPKQPYHVGNKSHNEHPEKLIELIQIPFQEKLKVIGFLADIWHRLKIGDVSQYDLIWVGYPLYVRYIPENYCGKIIYDCMDNHEALFCDQTNGGIKRLLGYENTLINRADIVFVSAQKLGEKIKKVRSDVRIELIRNAYSKIELTKPKPPLRKEKYKFAYVGTVSEWFDNDVIAESLKKCDDIEYSIIGPLAKYSPINDGRVTYLGQIRHEELTHHIEDVDCLIMPFILNEIILYVDPVKLYEYIAWGKCIVAPYYPEIARFEKFVYFYKDINEYCKLISKLKDDGFPAKFTQEQQNEFLNDNSWDSRMTQIEACLKK